MRSNNGKLRELKIATQRENGHVKILIADTGCGIPQDNIKKIFDPFFTTKDNGSGLGLAIVKSLIQSHNGTIAVESQPQEGTTFTIRIPAKKS